MKKIINLFLAIALIASSCNKQTRYKVSTEDPKDVSACRATLKASGENGGSKKIKEKGFCFSDTKIPEIEDNTTTSTNGFVNLFEAEVKGLKAKTKYMVRAYTKLTDGTLLYGDVIEFTTTDVYMVGDIGPSGGIVFSTVNSFSTNKYTEAAYNNVGTGSWGCDGTEIIFYKTDDGPSNTSQLISNCSSSAASYCKNITINGLTGWYLPTSGELSLLKLGQDRYPNVVPAKKYLSCSQWSASEAYYQDFTSSSSLSSKGSKSATYDVIPVRGFNP